MAEGPLTGPPERCCRAVDRPLEPLGVNADPGRAPLRCVAGAAGLLAILSLNPPRPGGPSCRAHLAQAVGKPRCSTIARTPGASFMDASTLMPASIPHSGKHARQQRGKLLPHRFVQHRPLRLPPPVRPPPPPLLHLPLSSSTSPGHTLPSASHGLLVSPARLGNSVRPSLHASAQATDALKVSLQTLYEKVNPTEPRVVREELRDDANSLRH